MAEFNLVKLDGYAPPAPTTYSIEYSDVNGEESGLEDGTTYHEQIRADVPTIKVGWTNLTQAQVSQITEIMANDTVEVEYYYGSIHKADMRKSSRSLTLKTISEKGETYWNLSFTLEG